MPTTCRKIAMTSARPSASTIPRIGKDSSNSVSRRRSAGVRSLRIGMTPARGRLASRLAVIVAVSDTRPRQNDEFGVFREHAIRVRDFLDCAVQVSGPFAFGYQQVGHTVSI